MPCYLFQLQCDPLERDWNKAEIGNNNKKETMRADSLLQQNNLDGFRSKFAQSVQKLFTKNLLTAH